MCNSSTVLPPLTVRHIKHQQLNDARTADLAYDLRLSLAESDRIDRLVDDLAGICSSHEQRLEQLGQMSDRMAADFAAYRKMLW